MDKTITVDGVSVEMPDVAAAVVQRYIDRLTTDSNNFKTQLDKALADMGIVKTNSDAATADAKVKLDTKDGEIAALKQQLKDAEMSPQKLDDMVRSRLDVVSRARSVLGDKYVADGKTEVDIQRAVVAAKLGDATAKAMPDAAVSGAFTALTTSQSRQGDGVTRMAQAFSTPDTGIHSAQDAAAAAYEERNKYLNDAWKNTKAN